MTVLLALVTLHLGRLPILHGAILAQVARLLAVVTQHVPADLAVPAEMTWLAAVVTRHPAVLFAVATQMTRLVAVVAGQVDDGRCRPLTLLVGAVATEMTGAMAVVTHCDLVLTALILIVAAAAFL